jgi:co-chaperonin GroES (HSP10)
MSIPKSKVLLEKEQNEQSIELSTDQATPIAQLNSTDSPFCEPNLTELPEPVQCCNDFVAILQFKVPTSLAIADTFKNEGIVVGVGPGVSDGAGGRLPPCVSVGDHVMFGERNIVATVDFPVADESNRMIIVSERNIICKVNNQRD